MKNAEKTARILEVNHPYVTVTDIGDVSVGEMVVFTDESLGQVMSFSDGLAQVISFSSTPLLPDQPVARLYQQVEFPVHPQLPGQIYTPVGQLMIDGSSIKATETRSLHSEPVPLNRRRRITTTLMTGVALVDQLLPLGLGQRQLITGDRKTGKTSFVISAAITQAQQGSIVVYAMIGKKMSDVASVFRQFSDAGVADKVVMIASTPTDSPSLIHITPFAAMSVAEYFRDQGQNVLIVLDDLSTHAKFYRQLALLAKQFPGRDSYPGDIFSTHARLLERAGCFLMSASPTPTPTPTTATSDKTEAKKPAPAPETITSITCLPLAETTDGDLTDYIVSNLISITDGHLLFDDHLFQQGQRPAIHTSLSVTRVGKQTLSQLGKDMNRKLNTFVTDYQRTQELSHFGTELREESQSILRRGMVLMDFFALSVRIPLALQYILIGTIWLDWWESKVEQGLAPEIDNLIEKYQTDPEAHQWIDELITKNEKMEELVDQLTVNKDRLIRLCQP